MSTESDPQSKGSPNSDPRSESGPSAETPVESSQEAEPSKGVVRKAILFGVLGVMLAALIYDYRVARPAVKQAYENIRLANIESNKDSEDFFTNEDIAEMLGREPLETFTDKTEFVEVYGWRRGLPWDHHKLYVVYKPYQDKKLFYRQAMIKYDYSEDIAPIAGKVVSPDGTVEELETYDNMMESEGRGGDERRGSERRPDVEDDVQDDADPGAEDATSGEQASAK